MTTSKPKLHRQTPVPAADARAVRGQHLYAVLDGAHWVAVRRKGGELAPAWSARAWAASLDHGTPGETGARVRVYDGQPHCTWDSLDGGAP